MHIDNYFASVSNDASHVAGHGKVNGVTQETIARSEGAIQDPFSCNTNPGRVGPNWEFCNVHFN